MNIEYIANIVSIIGTCCGLFSRIPQVYKTYKSKSAKDLSSQTIIINMTANSCFLFYSIVHQQYPIMLNCLSVITLEGSLVYMKKNFGTIKKSSSGTSLIDLDVSMSEEETN
tara:strand:+ start:3187 stop:3522 length:336 start_codon:yes stop_codon:yes gene_type:complete